MRHRFFRIRATPSAAVGGSPRPRTPIWILAAGLAACLSGCHDSDTVTGPPPPDPLDGAWHGSLTYAGGTCAAEPVDVVVSQTADRIAFVVQTACHGNVSFSGTYQSPSLTGEARAKAECSSPFGSGITTLSTSASGTASPSQIRLAASAFRFPFGSCGWGGFELELGR